MQSLLALAVRALLFSIAKKVSKNAMPANANPPEQKSSVPSLFNVHLGH